MIPSLLSRNKSVPLTLTAAFALMIWPFGNRLDAQPVNVLVGRPVDALPADRGDTSAEEPSLQARVQKMGKLNPEERRQLIDDVAAHVQQSGPTPANLRLAMTAARPIERLDAEFAVQTYERFAELFAQAEDEGVKARVAKLEGVARRLQLPGNKINIEGETVAGDAFDWDAYRGRVVLIDFWATWCGPCIREIPALMRHREAYGDRGFEIVGISLDDNKKRLEEFIKSNEIPWTNLFSSDPEAEGWNHPMAVKYGVMSIPTVILVDREGKVLSLQARGPELDRLLAEHLGPADEQAVETDTTEASDRP